MREERRELALKFRVGIFVLVALAAFLGMIYALGARARLFEARYTIHADFQEVAGLAVGATVRLAGVQIGRVSAVELPGEPGGKVRVDLTIAKQFADRIRTDSVARIDTQGLLGDKIVEITVGSKQAAAVKPGAVIPSREPFDVGQAMNVGAETMKNVSALADSLRQTAETLNQSKIIDDIGATASAARRFVAEGQRLTDRIGRVVDQVEQGRGWAHVLLYEEPQALHRLNDLLTTTQAMLDRVERGEGAAGVLASRQSTQAAQRFVALMDRIGRMGEEPAREESVLAALLFDPKYKAVLEDFRTVARNLRDVSDRVAGGRGTLGSLVKDTGDDGGVRLAVQDLQATVANLKAITGKIESGEGTLGALIADPTVYERLVAILEGAQRSSILRFLIRGLGKDGAKTNEGKRE